MVVAMDRDAVCATTVSVLAPVTNGARTFPAMVTCGTTDLIGYDRAGALKLVAYEPVLEVVVLTMPTQLVPDQRCTHTGREYTPGSLPVTLTISAAIAVDGASMTYGARADTTRWTDATAAAPRQATTTAR
jgi:hypothetical protein